MFVDQLGDLEQVLGALMRTYLRPLAFFQRFTRSLHCLIDIGLVTFGDRDENVFGRRVYRFEGLAGFSRDPFAVDEEFFWLGFKKTVDRAVAFGLSARMFLNCSC